MGLTWISVLITFALLLLHLTADLNRSTQSNTADDDWPLSEYLNCLAKSKQMFRKISLETRQPNVLFGQYHSNWPQVKHQQILMKQLAVIVAKAMLNIASGFSLTSNDGFFITAKLK